MGRVLDQLIDGLRKDDQNPIHALDGWLLSRFKKDRRSTVQDLAAACDLRMGPKAKGPELEQDDLRRWVTDALDRKVIAARTGDPAGAPVWSLTEQGSARLDALSRAKVRVGRALAWLTRSPSTWARAIARLADQDRDWFHKQAPAPRTGLRPITRATGDAESLSAEDARANLDKVDHIVVLMMENRSFDQMLGYLQAIDGQEEVRGFRGAPPISRDGVEHLPRYLKEFDVPKSMDPQHGSVEIAKQIHGGAMDGFIDSFADANDVSHPEVVMGYYTHRELPVYDYFAHNFSICDQWFSSVPAATWPNRLYALTGTCDPKREGIASYDLPSFPRYLRNNEDPDTWRWYSWDPGTLRFADRRYFGNPLKGFHHDHFRRVVQHAIEPGTGRDKEGELELRLGTGLLEDAANGDLPSVAWIDPNFVDLSILESNSNDDHPPSDVRAGQDLVMMVFRALSESPCWSKTMLIVAYDEHGGFYDHERPGVPPEAHPQFGTYGVRVPAFVVSPFVEPCTVSHQLFDHTSITRTILERFGEDGAVKEMAAKGAPRVALAEHLGRLLTRAPTDFGPPDYAHVNAALESWRHERTNKRSPASPEIGERSRSGGDWTPTPIKGFPAEFLDAARELRRDPENGLPAGHP